MIIWGIIFFLRLFGDSHWTVYLSIIPLAMLYLWAEKSLMVFIEIAINIAYLVTIITANKHNIPIYLIVAAFFFSMSNLIHYSELYLKLNISPP